ncbi:MAG: hypothetical protein LBN71_00225 [Tannerella sp.]|nr:hypothetical protein [Tannerella sp.]
MSREKSKYGKPPEVQGRIFERLFRIARKDSLTQKEMETYNKSILEYNDVRNVANYAKREGRQEVLSIIKYVSKGKNAVEIAELTGIPVEQVKEILQYIN